MRSPQQAEELRLSAVLKKQVGHISVVEKSHLVFYVKDEKTNTQNTHSLSPSVCLPPSLSPPPVL